MAIVRIESSANMIQEDSPVLTAPKTSSRPEHLGGDFYWPLVVAIVGRGGIFFLAYISLALMPLNADPNTTTWNLFGNNQLLNGWARWDAGWYKAIAEQGYSAIPLIEEQRNVVFFPLYPLLIRVLNYGIHHSGLAGIAISNVSYLAGTAVFYQIARQQFGVQVARYSVIIAAVFPFSFYFSAMYSEALFFLLVVSVFYFAHKGQWMLAALACALAGATRLMGISLIIPLFLLYLDAADFQRRNIHKDILWIGLAPLGLLLYTAFLWQRFSNPFVFITARYVSGWQVDAWTDLIQTLRLFGTPSTWLSAGYPVLNLLNLFIGIASALIVILNIRSLPLAYWLWSLLYLSGAFIGGWHNMGRYVLPVFTIYLALALLLKQELWLLAFVYSSTLLLALLTIMYTHWYWVT